MASRPKKPDFITLCQDLPVWQRDALRRLAQKGSPKETDLEELFLILLKSNDLKVEKAIEPQPITKDHIPTDKKDKPRVVLNKIGPIKDVNALADGQEIDFGSNGITVIYGQNGSGKSGYCRIAKKICRTRGYETVYPNVYEKQQPKEPAAQINFQVEGSEPSSFQWKEGATVPEETTQITVFDRHYARISIDQKNELIFAPLQLALLEDLSKLFVLLEAKLEKEIVQEKNKIKIETLNKFTEETTVYAAIEKIINISKPLPSEKRIRTLAKFGPKLQKRLDQLEEETMLDPKLKSDQLKRCKLALETLLADVEQIELIFGKENLEKITSIIKRIRAAKKLEGRAATKRFGEEPIPNIGSDSWRQMFSYARDFSLEVFPDSDPPLKQEGKPCLLCQQPLKKDAAIRLEKFNSYFIERLENDTQKLETELEDLTREIENLNIKAKEELKALLSEFISLNELSKKLADEIIIFFKNAKTLRETLLKIIKSENIKKTPRAILPIKEKIEDAINDLQEESEKLDKLPREEIEAKWKELFELRDKKKLSTNLQSVLQQLKIAEKIVQLESCENDLKTRSLSTISTTLRKALVSEEFGEKFTKEVKKLGIEYLPWKLNDTSDHGVSQIEFELDKKDKSVKNNQILSEGEFRAVALALFFAEIQIFAAGQGIVFDDPISSLDHKIRKNVAKRIIQAAEKGHQVVVFTHDLIFYKELQDFSIECKVPWKQHWVRYTPTDGHGVIFKGSQPWKIKPVGQRFSTLDKDFNELKKIHKDFGSDSEEYRKTVKSFSTDLRETWEQLVEEELLNGTVKRLTDDIQTRSLKGVEVNEDDYRTIYFGMKNVSKYSGHGEASARQLSPPEPEEIRQELINIKDYYSGLRRKVKDLEARRKLLTQPSLV